MERSKKYLHHIAYVEEAVGELYDPDMRRVIRLRYIEGLTWAEVADKTYWSERKCRTLHSDGIKILCY